MKIIIGGMDLEKVEKAPVDLETCTIDIWFTHGGVRWTACLRDAEGNQVGDAKFAYHKGDFKDIKKNDFDINGEFNAN
jgi:hypothetical protein